MAVVPTESRSWSITRLHVPLAIVIGLLLSLPTFVSQWYKWEGHTQAAAIHIDSVEVVRGGGVAYKNELKDAIAQQAKSTRMLLRNMAIRCRKDRDGGFLCGVELPE